MKYDIVTVLGPTAAGKTRLAAKLAKEFNGEIISADSRQVYKGMDIGTGKDLNDYIVDGIKVPYHLIDVLEPREEFNLFLFKNYFTKAYSEILERGNIPFLAGGTGLYLSSIIQNYQLQEADFDKAEADELKGKDIPELRKILNELNTALHNTTDIIDKGRLITAIQIARNKQKDKQPWETLYSLNIGINLPREIIRIRITERLKTRLAGGMIDEAKNLIDSGITYERLDSFGLEYRYMALYLKGKLNYNDMFQKLNSAIHNFAKRQSTWFRKMEREGVKINWIDGPDFNRAKEIILKAAILPGAQ